MKALILTVAMLVMMGGARDTEAAYNPCAWTVQAVVMHLDNDPLTTPTSEAAMSWTISGVAILTGSADDARFIAEDVVAHGVWTKMSPAPTSQRATFYPPHRIQRVLIQGPADARCDPAPTLPAAPGDVSRTPPRLGRRSVPPAQ